MVEMYVSARELSDGTGVRFTIEEWNGEHTRRVAAFSSAAEWALPRLDACLYSYGYRRMGMWQRVGSGEFAKVEIA